MLSIDEEVLRNMSDDDVEKLRYACMKAFATIVKSTKNPQWSSISIEFLATAEHGKSVIIQAAKTLSEMCGIVPVDPSEFTFSGPNPDWNRISESLKKNSLAIVTDYLPEDKLERATKVSSNFENAVMPHYDSVENVEEERWLFRGDPSKSDLNSYRDFAAYHKTLVTPRRNAMDYGIIDAFNIDRFDDDLMDIARDYIRTPQIRAAFNEAFNGSFEESNLNLYINDNTGGAPNYKMRDFHKDGMTMVKSFIYLSDCLDPRFGPYTVIPRSHRPGPFHNFNQQVNKIMGWHQGELRIVDRDCAFPCVGRSGTLILSSQAAAHRGMLQQPGFGRRLLTQSYFAKEKQAQTPPSRTELQAQPPKRRSPRTIVKRLAERILG